MRYEPCGTCAERECICRSKSELRKTLSGERVSYSELLQPHSHTRGKSFYKYIQGGWQGLTLTHSSDDNTFFVTHFLTRLTLLIIIIRKPAQGLSDLHMHFASRGRGIRA